MPFLFVFVSLFYYFCVKHDILNMSDIQEITEALRRFNYERDWDQFHNGKDLSIALSIESSELLEAFLW